MHLQKEQTYREFFCCKRLLSTTHRQGDGHTDRQTDGVTVTSSTCFVTHGEVKIHDTKANKFVNRQFSSHCFFPRPLQTMFFSQHLQKKNAPKFSSDFRFPTFQIGYKDDSDVPFEFENTLGGGGTKTH